MSLDQMLKRLPSHFKTDKDSNNYKLLSLAAKSSEDLNKLYDTIQRFWDVDQAEGVGLDRIGKDEGLSRGSYDEETYRKLIKIQYIVNMSEGDIESINTILRAYMGDDFLYQEEGWDSFLREPASIILNVSRNTKYIPSRLVKRIKPAGVRVHYVAGAEPTEVIINFKSYTFPVPYRICNTFATDDIRGGLAKAPITLGIKAYAFDVLYPITNTFVTSAVAIENNSINVIMAGEYRDNEILYKRAGTIYAGEGDI